MAQHEANTVGADMDAIRDEITNLRDDLRKVGASAANAGKHMISNAGREISGRVDAQMDSVRSCVKDRPLVCLGVAVGVGVVIGQLLAWGRR